MGRAPTCWPPARAARSATAREIDKAAALKNKIDGPLPGVTRPLPNPPFAWPTRYRTHSQAEYDGWIRYYRVKYFRAPCTSTLSCNHGTAFYKPNISSAGAEAIIQRPRVVAVARDTTLPCSFQVGKPTACVGRLAVAFNANKVWLPTTRKTN